MDGGLPGDGRLVGREAELARVSAGVRHAVRPAASESPDAAFLVLGPAGVGKSALLDTVAARAAAAGTRVLTLQGGAGTSLSPFDGLRRLLGPLHAQVEALPGRLGATVAAALGTPGGAHDAEEAPDPALLRHGVLTVLADAAVTAPVLVCVDDLDLLDAGSRDVVLAVVRRLADGAAEHIAVVLAQRGDVPPAGFAAGGQVVDLGPLTEAGAVELLDGLPDPPRGRARLDVLRAAAGNPLALVELSRAAAAGRLPGADAPTVLPLTATLHAVFGREVETMPAPTRRALLFAAAGEDRLSVLTAPPVEVASSAWEPAETVGLVSTAAGRVRFRHPLVASAVLAVAGPPALLDTHAVLAVALETDPGRRAWHLSASRPAPDEPVAAELAAFAERVQARGDAPGAAVVLERAAAVTPDGTVRAARLVRAAELAGSCGHVSWVQELAVTAEQLTDDVGVRAAAAALLGWALIMADRPGEAHEFLLSRARRLAASHPADALALLSTATQPTYQVGTDAAVRRLADGLALLRTRGTPEPPAMVYAAALAVPDDRVLERVVGWAEPGDVIASSEQFVAAAVIGAAAYLLDETRVTIAQLGPVVATVRRGGASTPMLAASGALGWALLDAGRLQAAADNAYETRRANTVPHLPIVEATALVQLAIVAGLRDPADAAATAVRRAEATTDPQRNPALAVHLDVVRSRVAAASDDHAGAWRALSALFDHRGRPRHRHLVGLALGDVASAAARAGHVEAARQLVVPLLGDDRWRSARQRLVDARAAAVLADDADERIAGLTSVVADPLGAQWPLEQALTQLDLADLLRRARQAAAAREVLTHALDTFQRLGSRRFEERTRRELRAAGVPVGPTRADPLRELTEQQGQIVRLAAAGQTNREIGQELFLSPRTVASHLYRAFPKLGITSRAQLPAVVGPLLGAPNGAVI